MNHQNILLTGATGTVGQHILFELLRHFIDLGKEGKIHLVIRRNASFSAQERAKVLLSSPFLPEYLQEFSLEQLLSKILVIDLDLNTDLQRFDFCLSEADNVCVIHCAASTNLMSSEAVEHKIRKVNHEATLNFLMACSKFAKKFIFVSTAFACGVRSGQINDQYLEQIQTEFRNPYERYKNLTEKALASFCEENQMPYQILRPSIVCGRLLDETLYYTPKFDVFYGYMKFFYKIMQTPLAELPLRIVAKPDVVHSNVIPVDYVAKVVLKVFEREDILQLNIVHPESVPLARSLPAMIGINGYDRYEIVDRMPQSLNPLEKAYYAEAGNANTAYLAGPSFEFDASAVQQLVPELSPPSILVHLDSLFEFATKYEFNNLLRWKKPVVASSLKI
ncbi:MAG: NAD-dependent epimerase/dehydratase family protein [Cytophagales bacterium]|nr:MAG: NAD-dependent epimerase/dehydratase family protein [Cytophagales bacterium]TAF60775.1 MAG: NAD-dependent epimerase/dehydratase family protein [Cytophagales bacterium]